MPLKILAVNWRDRGDPMGGGAEVHLHEILSRVAAAGHDVTWVSSGYPGAASEERGPDGIRHLRAGHWKVANFVLPGVLRRELRGGGYDLVVEDINKVPFYTPLYSPVPVLAIVPHLFGGTVFRETNPLLGSYVWASERPIPWVYRRCRFEAISESTADDLVARGIDRDRIEVIHCGMDHARYELAEPPARNPHPTLVHLGRLRRYKSVDVVIRAAALLREHFPGLELHIIGDGPDEGRLHELAARLGLGGAVHFRGYLPRKEIVEQLYRSHLFLNPSPKEGWGLTVIEANECGVPTVASHRPGLRDSVRDGETGRLARYGDPADFARHARELLSDPALWQRTSEAAVAWARSFSWERCASESLALMERCAGEGR